MEFCYAAVLRNDIPLVQHCPKPGNFDLFFQRYTEKNELSQGKTIVISDGYLWGIQLEEDGLTYICVLKHTSDHDYIDKTLDEIKSRFVRSHGNSWKKASPFGLQTVFEPQLVLVKQSLLSSAGITYKNENQHLEEEDIENNSSLPLLDNNMNDGLLRVKIDPVVMRKKWGCMDIVTWFFVILVGLFLIFSIIIIMCGGIDLRPRCIS